MKNDLADLKNNTDSSINGLKIFEQLNETRQTKIRNSIYYIIARAIKFGFNTQFLVSNCMLINKIIKDISLHERNDFIL